MEAVAGCRALSSVAAMPLSNLLSYPHQITRPEAPNCQLDSLQISSRSD